MEVIRSSTLLVDQLTSCVGRSSVALVPTMGNFHKGHLSLLRLARKNCKKVVCSIFVNPTQFNKKEDYRNYPKTLTSDIKKATSVGCDILFCPEVSDIYPSLPLLKIDFGHITKSMEGKGRPGHFNGVAIVLSKLFHIVQPTVAYFGEKDWQQCLLAKQLVADLSFPIHIEIAPTVREENGLAYSSRNSRLTSTEQERASCLYAVLSWASSELQLRRSPIEVHTTLLQKLQSTPGVRPEYVEIVDSYTLSQVKDVKEHKSVSLCVAAEIGPVRLIDHIRIQL